MSIPTHTPKARTNKRMKRLRFSKWDQMGSASIANGIKRDQMGSRGIVAGLLFLVLTACDPGLIEAEFKWPGGVRPTYPEGTEPVSTLRIEKRANPQVPGPEIAPAITQAFGEPHLRVPEIPYGTDRVFVLEVRPSAGADVDWYGISEPFSNQRGEHKTIPILMGPITPPQLVPQSQGETIEVVTATLAEDRVGKKDVEVILTADVRAVKARLSNISGLPDGQSLTFDLRGLKPLTDGPEGFRRYKMRWDLERDLEVPCQNQNYCARQVHARFIDAQRYASLPATTTVILDNAPPTLVPSLTTIAPSLAKAGQHIILNITASEIIQSPVVRLKERGSFGFRQVSPAKGEQSTTYTFVSKDPVEVLGGPQSFSIIASLTDLVGNQTREVEVGTFAIDTVVPSVTALEVQPERINGNPSGHVTVAFTLSKALGEGGYKVTIGSRPVDRCEEIAKQGGAGDSRVECVRAMRGDEIQDGTEEAQTVSVDVHDAAGNATRATGVVVFDFKAPTLKSITVTPSSAKLHDTAQLYIVASEPLEDGFVPTLSWASGRGVPFTHEQERDSEFERYFELVVSPQIEDGRYALKHLVLRDVAGNTSRIVEPREANGSDEDQVDPASSAGEVGTEIREIESDLLPILWQVDTTRPGIEDLVVEVVGRPELQPPRIPTVPGTEIQVRFTEREANPSQVHVLVGPETTDVRDACVVDDDPIVRSWICTYRSTGTEYEEDVERMSNVIVDASDKAGNRTSASASVVFDYRPPRILEGSETLQLVMGPENILRRVYGLTVAPSAVTVGTRIDVGFAVDEPLREAPVLATTPTALPFRLEHQSGDAFIYRHTLADAPRRQGAEVVRVALEDLAGNRVERLVALPAPGLLLDTVPPPAPNTAAMVHSRFPWGSDATGDGPHALVRADEGSVEPEAHIVILKSPSLEALDVLGGSVADSTGAVSSFELDRPEDVPEVFAVVIDGAGNPSRSVHDEVDAASLIQRGEWTASLRGKVPGSNVENPHNAVKVIAVPDTLLPRNEDVVPLTASEFAQLARTDGQPLVVSAESRWEPIQPDDTNPSARERATMAYDVVRGRVVLFGGDGIRIDGTRGLLNDTWEWDGRKWFRIMPNGASPPERASAAMAFDPTRGITVLMGGENASGEAMDDTWVWNGTTWTEAQTPSHPSNQRAHAAMAYDKKHGNVVRVGGYRGRENGLGIGTADGWNGDRWVPESGPCNGPCPLAVLDASATSTYRGLEIFGGLRADGLTNERWARRRVTTSSGEELEEWVQIPWERPYDPNLPIALPYSPPKPRKGAVYVGGILFGGEGVASDGTPTLFNDTWYDWMQDSEIRYTPPPARAFAASAQSGHDVLIFGGRGEDRDGDGQPDLLADTWRWNNHQWDNVTPSAVSPPLRSEHAMAYDRVAKHVVLFGGRSASDSAYLSDTWTWNGNRWTQMSLGNAPSARAGHAMTSMPGIELPFVAPTEEYHLGMFGGRDDSGPLSDFYLWNGTRWRWWYGPTADVGAPCSDAEVIAGTCNSSEWYYWPTRRSGHAMAYDMRGHRLFLFGGQSNGFFGSPAQNLVVDSHLYEWTDATSTIGLDWDGWHLAGATGGVPGGPVERMNHAMVYDSRRDRVVLFGGQAPSEEGSQPTSELWEWDGAHWNEIQQYGPQPRRAHAMVFDEQLGRTILYGGVRNRDDLNDLWSWDGQTWTEILAERPRNPGARKLMGTAYDVDRSKVVLFGGQGDNIDTSTWELSTPRQSCITSFNWSEARVDANDVSRLVARAVSGSGVQGGVSLELWSAIDGQWSSRANNSAGAFQPTSVASDEAPAIASEFVANDGLVHVRVAPSTWSHHLALEGVEITAEYTNEE